MLNLQHFPLNGPKDEQPQSDPMDWDNSAPTSGSIPASFPFEPRKESIDPRLLIPYIWDEFYALIQGAGSRGYSVTVTGLERRNEQVAVENAFVFLHSTKPQLKPMLVFHGTSDAAIDQIFQGGFMIPGT